MSFPRRIGFALGLACCLLTPAVAQEQFFNESKPMFDNCGDPSYANAVKNGVTLGFSVNPPEAWLDDNKQATMSLRECYTLHFHSSSKVEALDCNISMQIAPSEGGYLPIQLYV